IAVKNYLVERCPGAGCTTGFTQIATPTATTYSDRTSTPLNSSYLVNLHAVDSADNLGGFSSTAYGTTLTPDTQPPSVPAGLSATGASPSQINVAWTASNDNIAVKSYLVDHCADAGCTSGVLQIGTPTATSLSDIGLPAGTTFWYRVRATVAAGNVSAYSSTVSGTTLTPDTQPPSVPAGLTASGASASQINLSWTASNDNIAVKNYLVERCPGAGCTTGFTQIATPTATTHSDSTGLSAAATYGDHVRATDAEYNVSDYSTIDYGTPPPDTQPPSVPAGLSSTGASSCPTRRSSDLSNDNIAVKNYLVDHCADAGCTSGVLQIGTPTATSLSDIGLPAGTTFWYRVRATDAAGNVSAYSSTVSGTTLTPDTQPPSVPAGLSASGASASQINLSWTASNDNIAVKNYLVERCPGAGCTTGFTQIATPTATTYSDSTGLSAGATYGYHVRATDAAGNLGGFSSTAYGTTLAAASGLLAAYAFNEGTGTTTADASGKGHTGTLNGATWTTSGRYGKALAFNGS